MLNKSFLAEKIYIYENIIIGPGSLCVVNGETLKAYSGLVLDLISKFYVSRSNIFIYRKTHTDTHTQTNTHRSTL